MRAAPHIDHFLQLILPSIQQFAGLGVCVERISSLGLTCIARIGKGASTEKYRLPLENSLSGQCLNLMAPVSSDDYPVKARLDREPVELGRCDVIQCYPIAVAGSPWGVLKLFFGASTPVEERERWSAMANLLGLTVAHLQCPCGISQAEGRMEVILENARDAVISTNSAGSIQLWNRSAEQLFAITAGQAIGQPVTAFDGLAAIFLPESAIESKLSARQEQEVQLPGLPPMTLEYTLSRHRYLDEWEYTAFIHDVSERQQLSRNLEHLAHTDTLTGLANRNMVSRRLAQWLRRGKEGGVGFALLFVDMNDFKQFNDHHGHDAGDRALQFFAQRLKGGLRSQDLAGRWGGDEFVVLAEGITLPEQAIALAEKMVDVLDRPSAEEVPSMSASIGIALSAEGLTADDLLKQADTAMYRAKRQKGKGSQLALYGADVLK